MQTSENDNFVKRPVFSDEGTLHLCCKVNEHDLRVHIRVLENTHAFNEHIGNSPKSMCLVLSPTTKSTGLFFFFYYANDNWIDFLGHGDGMARLDTAYFISS